MEIQKAIEQLKWYFKNDDGGAAENKTKEAAYMAISALVEKQEKEKLKMENMMDNSISRQAAIDAVENIDWYHLNTKGKMESGANSAEHQTWYKADDIYKVLEELPSVQPKQKQGRWIIDNGCVCCSECGEPNMEWNYCPNCGARMDGETE